MKEALSLCRMRQAQLVAHAPKHWSLGPALGLVVRRSEPMCPTGTRVTFVAEAPHHAPQTTP